jgi:hypothetical protein
MVTGRRPFTGTDIVSIAAAALTSSPASPSALDRTVPQAVSDVILKALASNPAMRFQTAADLATALRSALAGEHPVAVQPRRMNRLWLAAAIVASVASVGWLAVHDGWLQRGAGQPTKNVEASPTTSGSVVPRPARHREASTMRSGHPRDRQIRIHALAAERRLGEVHRDEGFRVDDTGD